MSLNPDALKALVENQRQLDADGVEVGVSRQALEELLSDQKGRIPRAENTGRYLAETNDGRLLYLNHANEWQEMPNILQPSTASVDGVAARNAFTEAFAKSLDDDFGFWSSPAATSVRVKLYSSWAKANAEMVCAPLASLTPAATPVCNVVPPPETYGGSPDEPWTGKMPAPAATPVSEPAGGAVNAMAKIDEARKAVWNSYRHLAAREVALMNDAYDAVAALAKPPGPAGGDAAREALQKLDAKTLRGIIARWETRREYLNTNPSAYDAFIEREVAGISERALSSCAGPAVKMPSREWVRDKIASDPDSFEGEARPAATPVSEPAGVLAGIEISGRTIYRRDEHGVNIWSANFQPNSGYSEIEADKAAQAVFAALSAPASPPAGDAEADEQRCDAWSDFENEHLTDGEGHAEAKVYAACREAFDKAWPLGWEKANAAAFAAFNAITKPASPPAGVQTDPAVERGQ